MNAPGSAPSRTVPAGGFCDVTVPAGTVCEDCVVRVHLSDASPRAEIAKPCDSPTMFGTVTLVAGPEENTRLTEVSHAAMVPAGGFCEITCPNGTEFEG